MTITQAYQILGIDRQASTDEIKAAFRRKALELHPDKFASGQEKEFYSKKFKELREAFELIKESPAEKAEPQPEPAPLQRPDRRFGRKAYLDETPEHVPLQDKLGMRFEINTDSFLLWAIIIPAAIIVLGLVVRFFATLINR